jgi:hypothetical protein
VLHAVNTRRGFLKGIVKPLLREDNDEPFTLRDAREEIDKVGKKLGKLGTDISWFEKALSDDYRHIPNASDSFRGPSREVRSFDESYRP